MSYNRAVIFYNEQLKLKQEDRVFDVRFDTQLLPKGSIVCGFLFFNQKGLLEVALDPPALVTQGQEKDWLRVQKQALDGLDV